MHVNENHWRYNFCYYIKHLHFALRRIFCPQNFIAFFFSCFYSHFLLHRQTFSSLFLFLTIYLISVSSKLFHKLNSNKSVCLPGPGRAWGRCRVNPGYIRSQGSRLWATPNTDSNYRSCDRTATALTHCTASVQRLQRLHTAWPSLKSPPFRGERHWMGLLCFFNLSFVLLFCRCEAEKKPEEHSKEVTSQVWDCVAQFLMRIDVVFHIDVPLKWKHGERTVQETSDHTLRTRCSSLLERMSNLGHVRVSYLSSAES